MIIFFFGVILFKEYLIKIFFDINEKVFFWDIRLVNDIY